MGLRSKGAAILLGCAYERFLRLQIFAESPFCRGGFMGTGEVSQIAPFVCRPCGPRIVRFLEVCNVEFIPELPEMSDLWLPVRFE